jgi:4'-phosphopantetheinyl transferase
MRCRRDGLSADAIAQRYFAPEEARLLLELAPEQRLPSFYRCWTRKEAYLKAKGTGLTTKLQAFEVTFLPDVPPALLHTEVDGEDPSDWQVFELSVPDGYVAALVAHS